MKVFYCVDHDGNYFDGRRNDGTIWRNAAVFENEQGEYYEYPPAVCSIIVAESSQAAIDILSDRLHEMGFKDYEDHPFTVHEIGLSKECPYVLLNGDYGKSCIDYQQSRDK